MKKLLIAIFILITTAVGSDHSPLNIHTRLELIGKTTVCDKTNDSSWICFDIIADKYCDLVKNYNVEYSKEFGWIISYLGGHQNECLGSDHTTQYWEYRISKENVITEYTWHVSDNYDRVLDDWHKGEVSSDLANKQIEAIVDFTKNKWFDRSKI